MIASTPVWEVSGVNVFTANLLRGLADLDIHGEVLLTNPDSPNSLPMPLDPSLRVSRLQRRGWDNAPRQWRLLAKCLDSYSPCVYLPNYDYRCSPASALVGERVRTVGIVHSDDPVHYDHAARMGAWWSAIVAVSAAIGDQIIERLPSLADRLSIIPYGVHIPRQPPRREQRSGPLRIVYAGRLVQPQKRVLDLPRIAAALTDRGTPFVMRVVGAAYAGTVRDQLLADSEPFVRSGSMEYLGTISNEQVYKVYEDSDVIILTSEFEGLPVTLLEAMGRGCIPVVTDIPSGIPEVVKEGESGMLVPVGEIGVFADRLSLLHRDSSLRARLSAGAFRAVDGGRYRVEDMAVRYAELFERVLSAPPPPRASITQMYRLRPPDVRRVEMLPTWIFVPARLGFRLARIARRKAVNGSKRLLRRLGLPVK